MANTGQFERETAVQRLGEHRYRGELMPGWRIGAVPNGGYVLAVAGRALRDALPHKDPLSMNAFYLAPTGLGPIDCDVEVLRVARSTSFAQVKMYQAGELKVQVTAAFTELAALQGESWTSEPHPDYPLWDACTPLPESDIEFRQRVELRLIHGVGADGKWRPDGSGQFCGWLRHRDGSEPDTLSLLMFADACPPPLFTVYGAVGWVPTVELTVQLRTQPAPGPLQARLTSRQLTRGVVEEDGEYWDSRGALVAISRQMAKFRLPPG